MKPAKRATGGLRQEMINYRVRHNERWPQRHVLCGRHGDPYLEALQAGRTVIPNLDGTSAASQVTDETPLLVVFDEQDRLRPWQPSDGEELPQWEMPCDCWEEAQRRALVTLVSGPYRPGVR